MTAGARSVSPMLLQSLTERQGPSGLGAGCLLQRRHNRRWIGRMSTKDIFEDPNSSFHRRGSIRQRRYRQETSLSQQSPPSIKFRPKRHTAELGAINIRQAIMPCEALVDKRIIRS